MGDRPRFSRPRPRRGAPGIEVTVVATAGNTARVASATHRIVRSCLPLLTGTGLIEGSCPTARHCRLGDLNLLHVGLRRTTRGDDGGRAAPGEKKAAENRFGIDKHGKLVYP